MPKGEKTTDRWTVSAGKVEEWKMAKLIRDDFSPSQAPVKYVTGSKTIGMTFAHRPCGRLPSSGVSNSESTGSSYRAYRSADRARALAASSSRFFLGATVSSDSRNRIEIC